MITRAHTRSVLAALATTVAFAACAPTIAERPVALDGRDANRLPPPPLVLGTLDVNVVYPPEGSAVAARDSNFIFGSTGRGDATLTINGAPVDVAPNGAWLAFLPVPADGVYRLNATANGVTDELTRTVRVPAAPSAAAASSQLRIVESSVTPSGTLAGHRGEPIEISFRGTPGAQAQLVLPNGTTVPLVERQAIDRRAGFMLESSRAQSGVAEYVGSFPLEQPIIAADGEIGDPTLSTGIADPAAGPAYVQLVRGTETVRVPVPVKLTVLDPMRPRVAVAATSRPDSIVIGRRGPGSDQAWEFFWPNGTLLPIDGEIPGFYRVRLTPENSAWVAQDDVELLDPATPNPTGFVGPAIEVDAQEEWINVRFSMTERLPFRVDPTPWGISVEFYNALGRPAYVGYGPVDPFVKRLDWEQVTDELFRFDVHLERPLWGYEYEWQGTSLVLQVRRPPTIDPADPLRGLLIAVDAGHRGSETDTGAVGPTGLTEAEANLATARAISEMLRQRGAEVLEIRPTEAVVPLIDRPIIAADANADLFFSVHYNAFPDGVNPFERHGTTMFYFWPQSVEMARHLQQEIQGELGLPDRGVRFQNLGITRTTWMPTVLTETAFMMMPDQEAGLRNPDVIERIAAAHVRGLENFVREQATVTAAPGAHAR